MCEILSNVAAKRKKIRQRKSSAGRKSLVVHPCVEPCSMHLEELNPCQAQLTPKEFLQTTWEKSSDIMDILQ